MAVKRVDAASVTEALNFAFRLGSRAAVWMLGVQVRRSASRWRRDERDMCSRRVLQAGPSKVVFRLFKLRKACLCD